MYICMYKKHFVTYLFIFNDVFPIVVYFNIKVRFV